MLEAGLQPRCYTFYCENHPSTDLNSSRKIADDFGLELVEVPVPTSLEQIEADVRKLVEIQQAPKIKRTIIQCLHPWMYICPEMLKHDDRHIFIGFAADNYYRTTARDNKLLNKLGEEEFRRAGHRDHMFHDLNYVDANVAKYCLDSHGITMDDVYACEEIQEWFKQFPSRDLDKDEAGNALVKAPSVYAFSDYYERGAYYRRPSSYQVNSNLREFHEILLFDERLNPEHRWKNVVAVYNAMHRGRV
jgi:hypothetical protein